MKCSWRPIEFKEFMNTHFCVWFIMVSDDHQLYLSLIADSKVSLKRLEEELCCLQLRHDETLKKINDSRERFITSCLNFQTNLEKERNDSLKDLLSEKQSLEDEFEMLNKKNNALQNSMSAFVDEILEDLYCSNSALEVEIESRKIENTKLIEDIDELKITLFSAISME